MPSSAGAFVDGRAPHSVDLAPGPSCPGRARRFLRSVLPPSMSPDRVDTALLLVSELVTNGVLHARSGMMLTVTVSGDGLLVEVTDTSFAPPRLVEADDGAVVGRGIAIVDSLADHWGVVMHPGRGKTVWFDLSFC